MGHSPLESDTELRSFRVFVLRASRGWRNNPEIGIDALETFKIVLASARKTVLSCTECSEESNSTQVRGPATDSS